MATKAEINEDWEAQMDLSFKSQENKGRDLASSAAVLAMFMGTYLLFKNMPLRELEKLTLRQRSRYTIHEKMDGTEGPWSFSPTGYLEGTVVNLVLEEMKSQGYNLTDISKATTNLESPVWKQLQNTIEREGQSMYHEGLVQGQLEGYWGYDVIFQWRTCEDNENCMTEAPVCPDCEAYSLSWFTANEFPITPHDWCRCNEPEIEMEATNRAFI